MHFAEANDNVSLLLKYFLLSETQKDLFTKFGLLFKEWNQKINLISRKDTEHLYLHHILYSLSIAKFIPLKKGTCVVDVGTGGGFPGLPLAIMFPECSFLLIDSVGKKIKAVNALIQSLGLNNAKAMQARAEGLNEKVNFVTGRAVSDIGTFYNTVKKMVSKESFNPLPNGVLYLTGGEIKKELAPFGKKAHEYSINTWFEEEYFQTKKIVHIQV